MTKKQRINKLKNTSAVLSKNMIKVDPEKCIGCGLCSNICPHVFKLDPKTGKSEVISQDLKDCDLNRAVDSCPTGAISQE